MGRISTEFFMAVTSWGLEVQMEEAPGGGAVSSLGVGLFLNLQGGYVGVYYMILYASYEHHVFFGMHYMDCIIHYFKTTWRPDTSYLLATPCPQASCL